MRLCGFDLETPQDEPAFGLQPWRAKTGDATIKSFAAWSEDGKIKCARRMPSKAVLREFLVYAAEHKLVLVGWNVVFDVAWLCAIGLTAEVKACMWADAMLALKRVDGWKAKQFGGVGYGLKAEVAEKWPQFAGYGIEDIIVPQTEAEWRELLVYNMRDSKFTAKLMRMYLTTMTTDERRGLLIECRGIPDVALSAITGIALNLEALEPFEEDVRARAAIATLDIPNIEMATIRSPNKLRALVFDEWGYTSIKTTASGKPSTDKETLLKLSIEHPEDLRFGALMAMRKCNTQSSKFIGGVRKSAEYNKGPITYPSPFMSGTYSGRFTYSSTQGTGKKKCQTGIALHQWERGPNARNLLRAPEGYLLAEFDFSGQEMRLMAIESEDETMLELFESNGDGHAYMGASIEGKDYDWVRLKADTDPLAKEVRNMGKFANLSLQYRIGVESLMSRALVGYGLQLWKAKADHIKKTYLRTYRRVPIYWKEAQRKAAIKGYAETRGHRRIKLWDLKRWDQQQTAINFPIQGTGGCMKSLAIAVAGNEFDDDHIYAWDLHDALFTFIKDDGKAEQKVRHMKKILSNLPYQKAWGWAPTIPLPVDAKLGKSWGTLKGVD